MVCPLGPPAYVDSSTATRVNNPGRLGGRAALSVARGPSNRAANPLWDATQPEQHHLCQRNQGVWAAPSRVQGLAAPVPQAVVG